jgi:hypothetical protein
MAVAGQVLLMALSRVGEERKVYKVMVGKPEGKRPLGRPRRRCVNGIRTDLTETSWGCGMDSVGSGRGPVVDFCECGDEPLEFMNSVSL